MGVHTYQTNMTGGELSPRMFSRVDYQKYPNSVERLWNMGVKVTGGSSRRAGTQFVARAKSRSCFQASMVQNNAFQVSPKINLRLVPFVFNTQDAYVIEFGSGYMRFYKNRQPVIGNALAGATDLISNGAFDTDLTGWLLQQDSGATVTHEAPGVAQLATGSAGAAGLSQQLSALSTGTPYVVTFTVQGGSVEFNVGTALGSADLVSRIRVEPGEYKATFLAQGATAVVQFFTSIPDAVVRIDNVTAHEADFLELPTPYRASELVQLRVTQSADTLIICHNNHPPKQLQRLSDLVWTFQDIVFSPPPTEEVDLLPLATLTPGATVGSGVNFTTDAGVFLASDIHRQIHALGGIAVITAVGSATSVTVDILSPFPNTDPIGAGAWSMDSSPFTALTLGAKEPVNATTTLTTTDPAFRATDVGAFVHALDGIFEIITVSTSTTASAKILRAATGTNVVAGNWTLERDSWSEALGYPGVVTFFEQGLYFASTKKRPQTFWRSAAGDFYAFPRGTNADDALEFTVASDRVDTIRWMKSLENLLLGTIGSEYKVDGGDSTSVTPTNVKVRAQSAYGSDPGPDAIRASAAVLFVMRGRRQLREMAFQLAAGESGGFTAADITALVDHLTKVGITDIARVSSPDSYVLALLDDGRLAVAAYERPENVVAWSQFGPAGWEVGHAAYRAVCVIPSACGSGDEVWVGVQRRIAGVPTTFIEVFDGQLNTDAALVYEGDPVEIVTGMNHLNGETVDVVYTPPRFVQKGVFQRNAFQRARTKDYQTVMQGGSIELPAEATRVEIGLHYDSEVETLNAEVPTDRGTAQFQSKRTNTIYVRFYCTKGDGVVVQGESVPASMFDEDEITDFRREAHLKWDRKGKVKVKQTKPYPMTVLGIAYSWQVSDGDKP